MNQIVLFPVDLFICRIFCYDWHVMTRLGEIIMTRFVDRNPDYILTVETKGIPLAVMVARAFNKPLVIARRDSKVTEGSAISI